MLRLLPCLRALTRERAWAGGLPGPAAGEARMFPACYCTGKAKPRAVLLPLEPYGHGLLQRLPQEACRARSHSKRKSWSFVHEKMSYDTFFTMKRLIERSRSVGEVLRWVTQNPGKVSASHYPIALHKLGQLLQQQSLPPGQAVLNGESRGPGQVLEHPEFQALCQAIISDCPKFDNFSIVNCLYAAAALGLPGESPLVRVLEDESRSRLGRFNQKDLSMVFSSVMRLHPSSPHPLVESCLSSLERHLEKERHPQTLFLLLSYYRLRAQALQGHAASDQQLLNNRKILRLVRHTLGQVSAVREHELALLDEMLALCAQEANNKALEAIFSSQLFYENRQERFIRSMAEWLPRKVENLTPYTMALIAKYVARHRLREPRLLDTIAAFLLKRGEQLDSKVIQKLVFPFSRMNYRPSNHGELFPKLEAILDQKAISSPLATVNILMSMFQLSHFPQCVLHQVFSPAFIANVMSSPHAVIVRRYLSLLDAAVELEFRDYNGPRLDPRYRVLMFDHAMTADEANRKYSYKGLVAEALRQLVGEDCYWQDEVLPPGYCADFLLWVNNMGAVLPLSRVPAAYKTPPVRPAVAPLRTSVLALTSDLQDFAPFAPETPSSPQGPRESDLAGRFLPTLCPAPRGPCYQPPSDYYCSLSKESSLGSQGSSTLSSPSECLATQAGTPDCSPHGTTTATLFQFPIGKILEGPEAAPGCFRGEQPPDEAEERSPAARDEACAPPSPHLPSPKGGLSDVPQGAEEIQRVVLSVNDKWHYCQNSDILVGSRAMRDRHLQLLGYCLIQLPYTELEKVSGIEEAKQYLRQKLRELRF
ncbi:fas-activated serine/threonine kinase [Alligator mississippiensis]|uniref:Fas-activated serine/threonine kinase n=1 Tax=Alligator mississippiensis TaxID=8496 RepID=A0A151PJ98_ALLMI|nr:fas-activated serine/threonine kinase [Alligator mississippiensis]XP_019339527.1 fas-activated serine/threonine kinase [Alligator mississippiensis]XP_059585279.1 fas-activated serine/threonine kinase [Alligator mississippiensis]KYO49138.1 fas-activated serine/threonine kinase [Alligator mississippiensis]